MKIPSRSEEAETLEFLIQATAQGTRHAIRSRLAAGMSASAIRHELGERMRSEFSQPDQPALNAALIAAVHLTLGEMLN